jgi:hypothetical protein
MITKGPWHIALNSDNECLNDGYGYQVHHESNPVADYIPEYEDARAVAAVPDLIEALNFIVRCAKMKGPAGTMAYIIKDEAMGNAKAALEKAGVKP